MVDKKWQQPAAGSDVGHGFNQIYEYLDKLELRFAAVEKLPERIEALEEGLIALEVRVTALENPLRHEY